MKRGRPWLAGAKGAVGETSQLNPTAPTCPEPSLPRLTYRLDDLARALGISRRALERERAAGRMPRPDLTIGRMPLWRVETIQAWLEGSGR
jgi:hypothetical protein